MRKLLNILLIFLILPVVATGQGYTLDQCIEMAKVNNNKIKNSQIDLSISEHNVKQAFAAYFPSVSATGMIFKANDGLLQTDIDLSTISALLPLLNLDPIISSMVPSSYSINEVDDGVMGAIVAMEPIYAGGQVRNSNALAKLALEISRLQLSKTEDEVVASTEQYFWQIVSLKENLSTISTVEKQLDEILNIVQSSVNAGLTNNYDLLQVELQRQSIASKRLSAENGLAIVKIMLRQQVGSDDDNFDISFDGFEEAELPLKYYVSVDEGLSNRIDVNMLEKSVEAAKLQKRLEIGKVMPTVAAGAAYTYYDVMEKGVNVGMILGTVSVPLTDWWGGSHAINSKKLLEQKAINDRDENIQLLKVDIESKWNTLQQNYLLIEVAEKTIDVAAENLRVTEQCYNAGTVSITDLLNAQTTYQQGRDGYISARINYQVSLTEYLQSIGRKVTDQ